VIRVHLASVPDDRARRDPNGRAVSDAARSLTNADLLHQVAAAAEHLTDLGVGPADVVALRLSNRVEFVVLLFAAWRLGATVTPVNPGLTEGEVGRQLDDADARVVVVEDDTTPMPGRHVLAVDDLRRSPQQAIGAVEGDDAALALLIYTSGTTGVPKGVMLDHANLRAMVEMGRLGLGVGADDRCLLILPLFHVNGIVVSVLLPLASGASVVIASRFKPHLFFDLIEAERPTYFSAVPTIYAMLSARPDEGAPDTSSVRFAICGAAPASAELLERFEDRYGFPLIEGYGLSRRPAGRRSTRSTACAGRAPSDCPSPVRSSGSSTPTVSRCPPAPTARSSSGAPT
jgi:long-chain acyl-CoA synthetase